MEHVLQPLLPRNSGYQASGWRIASASSYALSSLACCRTSPVAQRRLDEAGAIAHCAFVSRWDEPRGGFKDSAMTWSVGGQTRKRTAPSSSSALTLYTLLISGWAIRSYLVGRAVCVIAPRRSSQSLWPIHESSGL